MQQRLIILSLVCTMLFASITCCCAITPSIAATGKRACCSAADDFDSQPVHSSQPRPCPCSKQKNLTNALRTSPVKAPTAAYLAPAMNQFLQPCAAPGRGSSPNLRGRRTSHTNSAAELLQLICVDRC